MMTSGRAAPAHKASGCTPLTVTTRRTPIRSAAASIAAGVATGTNDRRHASVAARIQLSRINQASMLTIRRGWTTWPPYVSQVAAWGEGTQAIRAVRTQEEECDAAQAGDAEAGIYKGGASAIHGRKASSNARVAPASGLPALQRTLPVRRRRTDRAAGWRVACSPQQETPVPIQSSRRCKPCVRIGGEPRAVLFRPGG